MSIIASLKKLIMKKLIFIILIPFTLIGCDKETETGEKSYHAQITGYNMNCNTCILYFPSDSAEISKITGCTVSNYYNAVNLEQNDFSIGQVIGVKIRPAEDDELNACKTLYPDNNYENIFVMEYLLYQL